MQFLDPPTAFSFETVHGCEERPTALAQTVSGFRKSIGRGAGSHCSVCCQQRPQSSGCAAWRSPHHSSFSYKQDTCRAALTRAQCSCCGRSGCRAAAGPPLPPCNLLCRLDTPDLYQLVPESLTLLEEMRSLPCPLAEGLCFPVVPKATEK